MLVRPLGADLELFRIVTPEEAREHEDAFIATYREIFSGKPYFEHFEVDEVRALYRRYTTAQHQITLLVRSGDEIVALAVALPLSAAPTVARELSGLVPGRHTMYLAELGVKSSYRGQKLGKRLVMARIRLMDPELFTHVVLRVAAGRTSVVDMYRSLGFTDVGVSMTVSRPRTNGETRTDERSFMSRVLSQVPVEED